MDVRLAEKTPDMTAISPTGVAVPPESRPLAMSPINRRRWQNFKSNRRGYWSLWIFLMLFIISLFAEFIANDKPFMIDHDGKLYFPSVVTYTETAFGGEFETAADYRDPYLQKLIAEKGGHIWWPIDPLFLFDA